MKTQSTLTEEERRLLVAHRLQRAKDTLATQTHQGVKQMLSLHFVATSKIDKRHSIFYGRLFNDRLSGDYDDFVQYDNAMLSVLRPQAEEFIVAISRL
jgi:uncharacterized protein (UPF0332 family)